MKRQKIRKGLLISALLLFPIIIWYFSPYLIIEGAFEHVVNGSAIVFIILSIVSAFLGRFFCGYLCPMGGLQECAMLVNNRPRPRDWKYYVKYVIWGIWLLGIAVSWALGKGGCRIDFLYMTDHGISVSNIYAYIIYYGIILLFFLPAIFGGKRFACHYFCWIAPFMVIGKKVGRKIRLPQLHIAADMGKCISCGKCSANCPMSIDVMEKVKLGEIADSECINCGECVDACPKKVLSYKMKRDI